MTWGYPAVTIATRLRPPIIGASMVSWDSTWGNLARNLPGGHVADVANLNNGQLRSGRSVELRVAAKLENLAVLRTLVAAVGTFEDLDFDAVADLRLAVAEACTRLLRSSVPDSRLLLGVAPRRGAHLPKRTGPRGGAGVRDLHDDEASEFAAVTSSSAQGSSSRSNSEYADVADMFRELEDLPDSSAQFQRQRDRIVERCLPLADHIAGRFDGRGESRDDLVQVARVGLVNAVIRFDVNAGSDFVSFAVPTIMGEVRRHFRDNSWSVKVPRRLKELHLRLGAATADLSQRLGRAPTATELAAELEMDRAEVVEGLVAGSSYNTLSIDSGGGGGDDDDARAIADTLGDVDASIDRIENRESLRPLLESLPE